MILSLIKYGNALQLFMLFFFFTFATEQDAYILHNCPWAFMYAYTVHVWALIWFVFMSSLAEDK